MRFWKNAVWAVGVFFLTSQLHAFKVEVGSFFVIDGVRVKDGQVYLPLTRRKYNDIRILDRDTYVRLQGCKDKKVCTQPLAQAAVKVESIRPAQTRENCWIADVSFGGKWLVVFLVFKENGKLRVQAPAKFKFLDNTFRQQAQRVIQEEFS